MNQRKKIRNIIKDRLDGNIKVKVFCERPHSLFLTNTPCVLVYFEDEPARVWVGSEFIPKTLLRDLSISVDVVTAVNYKEPNDNSTEDFLDDISYQIESILLGDDIFPADFVHGIKLESTKPYNIQDDPEQVWYAQKLTFVIPYEDDVVLDKKYDEFKEGHYDINGEDFEDNPLIEGQYKK